jgi:hypothetical protein
MVKALNGQNQWVLSQLEKGERLSSRDAVLEYGVQDLPKRISELRQMGHRIESVRVYGLNRRGVSTHWNVYWMEAKC